MKIPNINKAYLGDTIINGMGSYYTYMYNGSPAVQCPVVVDDVSQYQGTDSEVYDLSTGKWFEYNNLGQYEEYGIMPTTNDLTSLTTYRGKLAILSTDSHEYEWNGSSWVDLGSAGSVTTIKSPSYIARVNASNRWKIELGYTASTDTVIQFAVYPTSSGGGSILGDSGGTTDNDDFRIFWNSNYTYFDVESGRINEYRRINRWYSLEFGNYYIKDLTTGNKTVSGTTQTFQRTHTLELGNGDIDYFRTSGLTLYHGETKSRDFIPAIDDNDVICLYDKVSGQYFRSSNNIMPSSGGTIQDVQVERITPVKDYVDKGTIPTSVTASTLSEITCPFEGLQATVNGDVYVYHNGQWIVYDISGSYTMTYTSGFENSVPTTVTINKVSGGTYTISGWINDQLNDITANVDWSTSAITIPKQVIYDSDDYTYYIVHLNEEAENYYDNDPVVGHIASDYSINFQGSEGNWIIVILDGQYAGYYYEVGFNTTLTPVT